MPRAPRRPIRTLGFVAAVLAVAAASTTVSGAAAAGPQWTQQVGTATDDWVEAVAGTADGVYVTGEVTSALPGQVHTGAEDAFLQRYTAGGTLMWTRQFGTASDEYVRGIVVHGGAIYVVGSTFGALPGQASAGSLDAWIRRYEPNGDVAWTVQYGTPGYDSIAGVAVGAGGVWVTGLTDGQFPGETAAGQSDAYVRRFSHGGGVELTRQFGSAEGDGGSGIAVRRKRVHVVGFVGGTLPGRKSKGSTDAFLRTYRAAGTVVRTRQFGTPGSDNARDVAAGLGGVYVTGDTEGAMTPAAAGGWDGYLLKFAANGSPAWTRQFGSPVDDGVDGLVIAGGEVHVGGSTAGAFPGESLKGAVDAFLQSYSRDGTPAGSRQFGTGGDDEIYGIGGSPSGLYAGGGTDGTFAGESSAGTWDGFVRRIPIG